MREIISEVVAGSGSRTCVIDKGKRHSYESLSKDVARFSGYVDSVPGKYILSSARRCYTSIALYVYSVIKGYTLVPISANIDANSLSWLLSELDVKFYYTDDTADSAIQRVQKMGITTVVSGLGAKLASASVWFPKKQKSDENGVDGKDNHADKRNEFVYLIFTSGTTGKPKGVKVTEDNLHAYLQGTKTAFGFGVDDVFSHISPLTFDFSIHEIFLALYNGSAIAVLRENDKFNIGQMLKKTGVTVWSSVPSTVSYLKKSGHLKPRDYKDIRLAFIGGEPVSVSLLESFNAAAPACCVYSYYGPTECTVAMMACYFEPGEIAASYMPLGVPFGNHKMLIRDKSTGDFKDVGRGDAYIAGPQVTAGYWNNPSLSQDRFIENEVYGLMFKTGDIVERDSNGHFKFIARDDDDIKIGGYRFDTVACKEFVLEVSDAENAVVVPIRRKDEDVYSELIVFVLNSSITSGRLARLFRDNYDNYIQPRFFNVDSFPLTVNGKIDTAELCRSVTEYA